MLTDMADCSEHVRYELAFSARQMERTDAAGDSWERMWAEIDKWKLKPIAIRAVQGHNFIVTEDTPYDTRFDEDVAGGDSREVKLIHSDHGGEIKFLVHATKKGLNNLQLNSILGRRKMSIFLLSISGA